MTQYSLTCINNSAQSGSFVLLQRPPGGGGMMHTLAWLVRPVHQLTTATIEWTRNYDFVWSQTGMLSPGTNFAASQVLPADPKRQNMVELNVDQFGAPYFGTPQPGGQPDALTIRQSSNIPMNQISIGIGMSGAAICAYQAAPNMMTVFATQSSYWVAFGAFQQGQVLDLEAITNLEAVDYTAPKTARTATLGLNGRIAIS